MQVEQHNTGSLQVADRALIVGHEGQLQARDDLLQAAAQPVAGFAGQLEKKDKGAIAVAPQTDYEECLACQ